MNDMNTSRVGEEKSTDELRAEIEQTRERVSADVEALGTKLSPENLKAEMKQAAVNMKDDAKEAVKRSVRRGADQVMDSVSSASSSVADTARANPIPLALIGIGVGWLIWNARSSSQASNRGIRRYRYDGSQRSLAGGYGNYDYDDDYDNASSGNRVGQTLEKLEHRVREGADSVRRVASDKVHQAHDKMVHLEDAAKDRALRARDTARNTMEESPLLVGALALGAGIAVGLAIPSTEAEDQLVGQYRDALLDKAKSKAHELGEVAKETARRAAQTVKETAKQEVQDRQLLGSQAI
jgi:ElaB/YqjD/DUF883 family membrane-anchored ribosome-binding protein